LRLLWRMAGAPYIMGWDKFINEYSPSLVWIVIDYSCYFFLKKRKRPFPAQAA
jgi:hypothetical protein